MHVEVLVRSEPPAEQDFVLLFCQFAVCEQALPVGGCVDGVIGFVVAFGKARELTHHHRRVALVAAFGVEVTELMDARVGDFLIRVVHDGCALEIADGEDFLLEIKRAPRQFAVGEVEVAIEGPGVDHGDVSDYGRLVERLRFVEEIGVKGDRDVVVVRHAFDPRGVPVGRQALICVREVAVVVGVAHGEPGDDLGGQFARVGLPLFGGVTAYECLIQRAADERDRLLLEV